MKQQISSEIILKLEHVKKSFGANEVLKDINLEILKGETVVVLGKSGTGKSVILKCIVNLIIPDSGSINIFGEEIKDLDEEKLQAIRKRIGFLFQSGALYDSMSVRENLKFPLKRHFNLNDKEMNDKVEEALENVSLLDAIDKMPSELSGGMRKRVGLARTLILSPELMLYDEPTTGLDPITSKEISSLIEKMQEKYKMTSLVITHDIPCAKTISNKIVVLKEGRYIIEGKYEELVNSENEFVKSFFEY